MSYVKPESVVNQMVTAGAYKASLEVKDLLIRGSLSGALLGFATTLAITATIQTHIPIVGALIFPVGFVMIVLLGLELVTGSFALLPTSLAERKIGIAKMFGNWSWVFIGNLIGSLIYASLFVIATTKFGHIENSAIIETIKKIAEAKTLGYEKIGTDGMITVFTKAILCNWMVTLGVVMALTSTSTIGKIFAMWLPILTFFAQGFEHAVVNMFVIPAGMMLGANISISQWWIYNEIPVTLGNILGGVIFTGLALYMTHGKPQCSQG
ncbi:MAG: formate/nitrite transporter family protein [Sulfurospirillum sp.]